MRTPTTLLAAAGLFLLGTLGLLGGAAMLAPTKPAVIASVDLEKVYASLDEQAAADAALEALAAELAAAQEKSRSELKDKESELESFTVGSDQHRKIMRQLEEKLVLFKTSVEFDRQQIEVRRAEYIRGVYARIKATLKTLSKENGWDIVFLDDSIPPIEISDPQRTMQQISARRMLFCDPALDVTPILIARMNADFAAGGGKVPAAAGGATTPGAAPTTGGTASSAGP